MNLFPDSLLLKGEDVHPGLCSCKDTTTDGKEQNRKGARQKITRLFNADFTAVLRTFKIGPLVILSSLNCLNCKYEVNECQ